jgi:hypothetical protein
MTTYRRILDGLRSMSPEEEARRIAELTPPTYEWPYGMPGAIDARLVIIGLSPGGSRSPSEEDGRRTVEPQRFKTRDSWFYYPDGKGYWERIRRLSCGWFRRDGEAIDELEALSLTASFNLSTIESGDASRVDAEPELSQWVTKLVETVYDVELVVLIGLKSKLSKGCIDLQWRDIDGGQIGWKECALKGDPIPGDGRSKFISSGWIMQSSMGRPIAVVAAPNHPSRPPFGQGEEADRRWNRAVESMAELGVRLLASVKEARKIREVA